MRYVVNPGARGTDARTAAHFELEVPTELIVAIGEKVGPLRPLVVAQRAAA